MAVATEDMIAEMVKAIVDEVDPVQIILFGSQARGEGHEDSDLDFLLVQDPPFTGENARRKQMARLLIRFAHTPISQDFLIYAPDEIDRLRKLSGHVIAHALKEGIVLYERG